MRVFSSGAGPYRKTGVQPRIRKGMLFRDMREPVTAIHQKLAGAARRWFRFPS
jgi:hypothetical protein